MKCIRPAQPYTYTSLFGLQLIAVYSLRPVKSLSDIDILGRTLGKTCHPCTPVTPAPYGSLVASVICTKPLNSVIPRKKEVIRFLTTF